jgi:uncharacterized protein YceH (UPF0502 family)
LNVELTENEARVIGALMEKAVTTPNQYPLSLNALTNACNQKSNREPVLSLDEETVQETVDELISRHLVSAKSGFGSRVAKYRHRFFNSEFGFRFTDQDAAVVCVLLLRGPQTPGELRSRTERLCEFDDVRGVEETLRRLMDYEEGPFVMKLARERGRRESRYAHLFSGEPAPVSTREPSDHAATPQRSRDQRLERLEEEVGALRRELEDIRRALAALAPGSE